MKRFMYTFSLSGVIFTISKSQTSIVVLAEKADRRNKQNTITLIEPDAQLMAAEPIVVERISDTIVQMMIQA